MPSNILGGRYAVQDRIGTGGMATVYRGLDEVLGRTVAIKTMLPQYASDPSFAARFKQEAQAAAALQSPYIVQVYDWGRDGDTYYIVMEYLRGTDLKSGIRKHGALDCKKVAQIGSQIAQALSVAHKHDIIHRDIKPQNIMVQPDGNIKVMDFGIARAKNSHLTTDNSVLGTAHYVSPEQTQGKDLGPTTDIYSLGIVMYEAATGEVPFKGDDAISVALKQVNEQPKPPSQLNPNVDPSLESIILKCMQKDPAARFQSANELYRVLRDYLAGRTQAVNSATGGIAGAATSVMPAQVTTRIEDRVGTISPTQTLQRPVHAGVTGTRFRPLSATEQAEAEEAERSRRHSRNVAIGVILGIALLAGVVFGVWRFLSERSRTYEIPYLLGLTEDEALAAIEESPFELGDVKPSYSDDVEEGVVIDQSPGAGRQFEEGTTIDLVVSQGPEPAVTVTVPDLTDLTPSEVEERLSRAGLVGRAGDNVFSDTVEVGHVAEQSPKANEEAKAGDTVTYYLSKGSEGVVVPNVSGDTEAQAREAMEDAGLVPYVITAESSTVTEGYVISVSPTSGTPVDKGSIVTITVSSGEPQPVYVSVTNVVGQNVEVARARLEGEGYVVATTYVDNDAAQGTVISMYPTTAVSGDTITLTVSNGPTQVTPDPGTTTDPGTDDGPGTTGGDTGDAGTSGSDTGDGE